MADRDDPLADLPFEIDLPREREPEVSAGQATARGAARGVLALPDIAVSAVGKLSGAPVPTPSEFLEEAGAFRGGRPATIIGEVGEEAAFQVGAGLTGGFGLRAAGAGVRGLGPIGRALSSLTQMSAAELVAVETALASGSALGVVGARKAAPDSKTAEIVGLLVGQLGTATTLGLVRLAREVLPAATLTGSKAEMGRRLAEAVPRGSAQEEALEALVRGKEQFGIEAPTTVAVGKEAFTESGRRMGRPLSLLSRSDLESRALRQPSTTQQQVETAIEAAPGAPPREAGPEATQEALRRFVDSERASLEAPVVEAERRLSAARLAEAEYRRQAHARVRRGREQLVATTQEAIDALGPVADSRAVGEVILTTAARTRRSVQTALDAARREIRTEASTIDVDVSPLIVAVEDVVRRGSREAIRASDLPRAHLQLVRRWLPKEEGAPARATVEDLFGLRERLNGDIREARSSQSPKLQRARLLNRVRDRVEAQLDRVVQEGGAAADAVQRYRNWLGEMDAFAQRFRQGAIGDLLRPGARGEKLRVAPEDVAAAFLGSGRRSLASVEDFVRAVGDEETARRALRDAALGDFVRSAVNEDGTVSVSAMDRWLKSRRQKLAAFPGLFEEVSGRARQAALIARSSARLRKLAPTAAKIEQAPTPFSPEVERLEGIHQTTLEAAKRGVATLERSRASLFLDADPREAVEAVFGRENLLPHVRAREMQRLVQAVGGDETAMNGLRRGVWDYMKDRFLSEHKFDPLTGTGLFQPKAMRNFIDDFEPTMRVLYPGETLRQLKSIVRAAEVALDPTSKITTQVTQDVSPGLGLSVSALLSRFYGFEMGRVSKRWVVTEGSVRGLNIVLSRVGRDRARQVVERALFDPRYTQMLIDLGRVQSEKAGQAWIGRLGTLSGTLTSRVAATAADDDSLAP